MGLSIKWDITYHCNLFCEHCVNGNYLNNTFSDEICLEKIKQIILDIKEYVEIDYIHFLGGEPLTRKDFIEITDFLEAEDIPFGFNTNGLLFNSQIIDRIFNNKCLQDVVISLEGPNEEINDHIRGKKVFSIAQNRINYVNEYKEKNRSTKAKLNINTVLCTENYKYINDMIKFCNNNKIDEICFLDYIEDGNGKGKKLGLSIEQKIETLINLSKLDKNLYKNLKIIPKFVRPLAKQFLKICYNLDMPDITHYCNAGLSFAFIDNYGNLYPCDRQRENIEFNQENICLSKNKFVDIWNSQNFDNVFKRMYQRNLYMDIDPCSRCNHLLVDCFPCYVDILRHKTKLVSECKGFLERAEQIGVDLFNG